MSELHVVIAHGYLAKTKHIYQKLNALGYFYVIAFCDDKTKLMSIKFWNLPDPSKILDQEPREQAEFSRVINQLKVDLKKDLALWSEANLGDVGGPEVTNTLSDVVTSMTPRSVFLFTGTDKCREDAKNWETYQPTSQKHIIPEGVEAIVLLNQNEPMTTMAELKLSLGSVDNLFSEAGRRNVNCQQTLKCSKTSVYPSSRMFRLLDCLDWMLSWSKRPIAHGTSLEEEKVPLLIKPKPHVVAHSLGWFGLFYRRPVEVSPNNTKHSNETRAP